MSLAEEVSRFGERPDDDDDLVAGADDVNQLADASTGLREADDLERLLSVLAAAGASRDLTLAP